MAWYEALDYSPTDDFAGYHLSVHKYSEFNPVKFMLESISNADDELLSGSTPGRITIPGDLKRKIPCPFTAG